jgi:hypothetical protein
MAVALEWLMVPYLVVGLWAWRQVERSCPVRKDEGMSAKDRRASRPATASSWIPSPKDPTHGERRVTDADASTSQLADGG